MRSKMFPSPWFITLLISFSISSSLLCFSPVVEATRDTLTANDSLSVNQTLISAGGRFELGFFSEGNFNKYYVGIWYKGIPSNDSIVWVANRDAPSSTPSCTLQLPSNGNLFIMENGSNILWSTNLSQVENPALQLLDSGNLVIREADDENPDHYIWQSFDYPTDTLLPGQKLGRSLKTILRGNATKITSTSNVTTVKFTSNATTNVSTNNVRTATYTSSTTIVTSTSNATTSTSTGNAATITPTGNATTITPTGNVTSRKQLTKRRHLHTYVFIAISTFVAIIILCFLMWMHIKRSRSVIQTLNFNMDEIKDLASLQFDLELVKAATRNFSSHNKLGEGGFGEVYKGQLNDGQQIAVKRLSESSRQGIVEFKTEALLVAKLQHKNLVKLLGFCLGPKEKILIYEYLQNSSLDKFLSDPTKKKFFNWQARVKIIVGIARGLMYLHEDSRLKIIHRDLKPSNILLDENMNPKIADFGLAKLFTMDQTQDDTKRIVGTRGYMAPEYAVTGHFSVKSDVYSFGIIVLEIVTGERNRFFGRSQHEEALLHRAWRLWNEEKAMELVDTSLGNGYLKEEVKMCIQIALLSIQESAVARPNMVTVVAALSGQSINLPLPKAPSFFGNTSVATEIRPFSGAERITDIYPR